MEKHDILDFINKFKFAHKKELEHIFTSGNCYYFAVILKDRFGGEIYYLPIENHFVCKLMGQYFDITGEAGINEKPISWDALILEEPKEARRIYRDCILFETRKII